MTEPTKADHANSREPSHGLEEVAPEEREKNDE